MKRLLFLLSLFVAITLVVLWLWRRTPRTLIFNVSQGFQGPFILVEDPGGAAMERGWGRTNITVTSTRIVRLRSLEPLAQDWHKIIAVRPDGTLISFDNGIGAVQPNDVALRGFRFLRENLGGQTVSTYEVCLGQADDDTVADYQSLRRLFADQAQGAK